MAEKNLADIALAKVGAKRQLTLPQEIVELFNFKQGDFVGFVVEGESIRLVPLRLTPFDTDLERSLDRKKAEMKAPGRPLPKTKERQTAMAR